MSKQAGIIIGSLGALALAGCFNTDDITNGGLSCGNDGACPDGFTCVKDDQSGPAGRCWRKGGREDAGGQVCTVGTGGFGPFATCSLAQPVGISTCDPVCQAGCACDRRCMIEPTTLASFRCESTAPPATLVPVQGTCTNNASACEPGSVCISDDVCPWQCFRMCRKDVDCPSDSRCSLIGPVDATRKALPNLWLCSPPIEVCNPSGAAECGAARTGFKCVFLAGLTGLGNTDSTVCDCATYHDKPVGSTCSMRPDDCRPGSACVDGVCRQICDRQSAGTVCATGTCNTIYNSTRYGYCQ